MSYQATFSNVYNTPLSLTGSKKVLLDEIEFQDNGDCCNITKCNDGVLTVCCKVDFKKGFIITGDLCDIDSNATFKAFTATEGYYLEKEGSTCANPIARTRAVSYFTDLAGPSLSTVFRNYAGTQGDAKLIINSTSTQPSLNPSTRNYGIEIIGGSLARTGNISINTVQDNAKIDIISDKGDIIVKSEGENGVINRTATISMADEGAYFNASVDSPNDTPFKTYKTNEPNTESYWATSCGGINNIPSTGGKIYPLTNLGGFVIRTLNFAPPSENTSSTSQAYSFAGFQFTSTVFNSTLSSAGVRKFQCRNSIVPYNIEGTIGETQINSDQTFQLGVSTLPFDDVYTHNINGSPAVNQSHVDTLNATIASLEARITALENP
jgi:hypothetical protein